MSVRKLKANQRGPRCSYCDTRAVWRGHFFSKFACAHHEQALREYDAAMAAREPSEAERMLGI